MHSKAERTSFRIKEGVNIYRAIIFLKINYLFLPLTSEKERELDIFYFAAKFEKNITMDW